MKKVTQYQTSDGQTFSDRKAAKLHETTLDAASAIKAECEPIFKAAPEANRLLTAMLADPTFFIDALKSLAKLMPKGQAASQDDEDAPTLRMAV